MSAPNLKQNLQTAYDSLKALELNALKAHARYGGAWKEKADAYSFAAAILDAAALASLIVLKETKEVLS